MMTDTSLRLTDNDVAAFYGAPFDQLTLTQQALSDEFWDRRAATGKAGCNDGHPCRSIDTLPMEYGLAKSLDSS